MAFKFKNRRGLLPILCATAALAAVISTVKADEPGSSAADETGMGNSYEYPQASNKSLTDTKPDQQAGTQASKDRSAQNSEACQSTASPVPNQAARTCTTS